ncbi:MAG: hypothetical protein VZR09_08700 [Candidatus Gastranaerophilaceae bacterium]|nr:hypothetical protein [Candidatus Gastranaerophilaceae bacterium]
MKRLLIVFIFSAFFLLLSAHCSFANEDNKEYIKEINQVINFRIPIAKRQIKEIEKEFKTEQNADKKQVLIEQGIDEVLFNFYMELINTTDKYMNIKQTMPVPNWHGDLQIFMEPYLKNYGVNIQKTDKLNDYAHKKYCKLKLTTLDMSNIPPDVMKYAHKHGYDIVKQDEQLSDEQTKIYQLYSKYDWEEVWGGHFLVFNLVYLIFDGKNIRFATKEEAINFEISKW